MCQSRIRVVDLVNNKLVPLPVTSGSSLLKTTTPQWDSVGVDRLYMPASESPEIMVRDHLLTIQLSPVHTFETLENGRVRRMHKGSGSVTLAPSGFRFRGNWDRDVEIIVLTLQPSVVEKCAKQLHDANSPELLRCIKTQDPQIQYIGLALEAELKAGSPGGRLYYESLASALAVQLLKKYSVFEPKIEQYVGGLPEQKLRGAIDYINDNLSTEVSVEALAAVTDISTYYFIQLFRQSTGTTPYQYVLQCRVERAKQLLRTTKSPIIDIAIQVGYKNQSHFTKVFRKLTGTTPKEYRNSISLQSSH